jgi:foldase protein PrsA
MDKGLPMAPTLNRRSARILVAVCGVTISLSVAFGGFGILFGEDDTDGGQTIVATVNGRAITYQRFIEVLVSRQGMAVLQELIDEKLLQQAARRFGINVTDQDIEAEVNRLRLQYPSEQAFQDSLRRSGQTLEQLRERLRMPALMRKISRAEASSQIGEKSARDYYEKHKSEFISPEKVRLRDLLLDTRENATELHKVLKSGGDFAGLARAFSLDPATKPAGGYMGILPVDSLAPHLARVVKDLKPGEISPVIEAPDGWYILKLEQRIPARQQSFEEVREQIIAKLVEERAQALQSDLLQRLRRDAKIEIDYEALRLCQPSAETPRKK